MDAVSPPSAPSSSLTVEELLEVLLLCFEAAADAFPPFVLAYAQKQRNSTTGQVYHHVWQTKDLDHPPQDLPSSFPPTTLPIALARWNMCDIFAWLLEAEAKRILHEHHGASACWLQIAPEPDFIIAHDPDPRKYETRWHSVLLVTERDGSQKVMDGTPVQFGWPRSTWLLSSSHVLIERVDHNCVPNRRWPGDEYRYRTGETIKSWFGGFWELVQKRMEQLFGELNWDALRVLSRERRVSFVKKLAEIKFARTWDLRPRAWEDEERVE